MDGPFVRLLSSSSSSSFLSGGGLSFRFLLSPIGTMLGRTVAGSLPVGLGGVHSDMMTMKK